MLDDINLKTMLIVEDDDALRERLAAAMTKRGFEVRTASSVAEGRAALEQDNPVYAIIDLRLLDGNGLDVVKILEKHHLITVNNQQDSTKIINGIPFKGKSSWLGLALKGVVDWKDITEDEGNIKKVYS